MCQLQDAVFHAMNELKSVSIPEDCKKQPKEADTDEDDDDSEQPIVKEKDTRTFLNLLAKQHFPECIHDETRLEAADLGLFIRTTSRPDIVAVLKVHDKAEDADSNPDVFDITIGEIKNDGKIQAAFLKSKMQLAVEIMQCSRIILKRGVRGQPDRSAAKFALAHINAALQHSATQSFARLVAGNDPKWAFPGIAWAQSVSQAKSCSSILLHRAARRFLLRRHESDKHQENNRTGAIRIHTALRAWRSRQSYLLLLEDLRQETKEAAVLGLQSVFGAWRDRQSYLLLFEDQFKERNAAIRIQTAFRGRKSGKAFDLLLQDQRHDRNEAAAIRLQTAFIVWNSRQTYLLLLDDYHQRKNRTAAIRIQTAFRRLMGRDTYQLNSTDISKQRDQAVIQLQRMFRVVNGRILASASIAQIAEMSRYAAASVRHATELTSTATVFQLLEDQSSPATLSPCVKHLRDRAKEEQAEACFLAVNVS